MKKIIAISCLAFSPLLLASDFTLNTSSFKTSKSLPQKFVYKGFGCDGKNISPELHWSNPPEGTKSFAVTVYDPDAPTGSGWWHWTVANIPADARKFDEGASNRGVLPKGSVEGRTDFGGTGYGGACPPKGDKPHRYIFTIYALKTEKLDINQESSGALVGFNIKANSLGNASFTVKFNR